MPKLDKLTRAAVDALEDVKARDVVVFDVKKMTAFFDHVVVATGDSNRHCRALASRVQEMVKAAGGKIYGVEGEQTGEWLLVDIGAALVHIMQPAIRQYYNIEELWAPAPKPVKAAKAREVTKAPKTSKASKTSKAAKVPKARKAASPRKSPPARRGRAKAA
jgi:ribosome-associated protein